MRLLCDEMLKRLGRWLRAAGYDTAIAAGGTPDAELLACCAAENPAPADAMTEVPPSSRATGGPLQRCPRCGRLYWPGGHVR